MKTPRRSSWSCIGFTLTELLVAVAILSLIILTVSLMLSSAQKSIAVSHQLTDCDDQARLVLARLQNDFTKIVKRTDVDFISAKQVGNDAIFFYSQAVGDSSNTSTFPNGAENPVSLVGYTIGTDPNIQNTDPTKIPTDLQRLGRGLNWVGIGTKVSPYQSPLSDNMVFLTSSGTLVPYFDANSTLDGHWSTTGGATYNSIGVATPSGTAANYVPTAPLDPDYHVIGDEVFRFEFCYLLKDGSYSDYPAEANSTNVPSGAAPLILQTRPPKTTDDSTNANSAGTVGVGTRWVDQWAGRAYLCTSSTKGAAVWQGLGVQDVAAVVVAIALIDRNSRSLLYNTGGASATTASLASLFADSGLVPTGSGTGITNAYTSSTASTVKLMQQNWRATINASTFASSVATATGVPAGLAQILASHITTYQRYIYLNTAASL